MTFRSPAKVAALALLWCAVSSARAGSLSTTTSLSASPNPATTLPQSVTLTAFVTYASGVVAEGTVTFYADNNAIPGGSLVPASSSGAHCSTTLAAGQHTLQARYSGSSTYASSISSNFAETVNYAPTTTTAANASAVYSLANQNVSLTASVTYASAISANSPVSGGSVLFAPSNGSAPIGPQVQAGVSNGSASGTFALPGGTAPGVYPIQTSYSGSSTYAGSSDSSHSLTVTAPAPTAANAQGAQIVGCSYVVLTGTGYPGSAIGGAFTDAGGNPWPGAGASQLTFAATAQNGNWNATLSIPAGLSGSGLRLTVSQVASGQSSIQTAAYTGITVQTTQGVQVASFGIVNGQPTVTMYGCAGETYQLQWTQSLTAPSWVPVAFAMPTACGVMQLVDPGGQRGSTAFYRVVVQ